LQNFLSVSSVSSVSSVVQNIMSTVRNNPPPDDLLDRAIEAVRHRGAQMCPPADVTFRVKAQLEHQQRKTLLKERVLTMFWKARYPSAAAAVLIAAMIGWMLLGPTAGVAFADVLQNMREVRTATFNSRTEMEGQPPVTGRNFYMQPGSIRVEIDAPFKSIMIWDYEAERGISLMPEQKKAIPMDFRGAAAEAAPPNPFAMAHVIPPGAAQLLREEEMEGKMTNVYHAKLEDQQITFWADAKTALPVKVEWIQKPAGMPEQRTVMTGFQWNPVLDEALFSIAVPKGYEIFQTVDLSHPRETDLVEALRIWTDLSEGPFPEKIGPDTLDEFSTLFIKTGEKGPEALKRWINLQQKFMRGLMFTVRAKQSELDWHYAGKGVKLGEADKPVAWWRATKDAPTYRVLYGDLTIKDAKPEDLPKRPQDLE
jgi:outer membrane lipoprotein-sorting protein